MIAITTRSSISVKPGPFVPTVPLISMDEDLFSLPRPAPEGAEWAWPPSRTPCRYWQAEIGGRTRLYPVEATPLGVIPHDGIIRQSGALPHERGGADPETTLVMACCDPA